MKLLSETPFLTPDRMIRMYEFPNGLRALLLKDAAAPVVAYQTWFRVGSRREKLGTTGIAHLFEHLMFNETEHLKPGELDRMIELRGGHTNAATWVDWTYYQNDLPASELELIIRLEADRMAHLVLHSPQLESEREVVMNERRFVVEDNVDGFMSEQLFQLAFTKHPYHWPTIGFMQDIQAISLEDARSFYRTYYAPNQATLVVVGDIDEQKTLDWIEQYYGQIKPQSIPKEEFVKEPPQEKERRSTFVKPVVTERLLIGYKAPEFLDPRHLRLQILADILLGGPSSRLYRELIVEKEIASSADVDITPFRDPGMFQIRVTLQQGHKAQEAEECIYAQLRSIQEHGPTQDEVDRAKARFLTGFYLGLQTAHGKAAALGEHEITAGDYRNLFRSVDEFKKVSVQQIQDAARTFFRPEARTVIIATPEAQPSQPPPKTAHP